MTDTPRYPLVTERKPDTPSDRFAALAQFLPLTVKGVSMNDGSISFGPRDLRMVLGYVTNACSFGDFVNGALRDGRFGDHGDAVTQMRCAEAICEGLNEIGKLRAERDELYMYLCGLLGLLQLVRSRDDMPEAISEVLNTNHRAADAAAYLTQIVPPRGASQSTPGGGR